MKRLIAAVLAGMLTGSVPASADSLTTHSCVEFFKKASNYLKQVEDLRTDPRYSKLSPAARAPLDAQWQKIQSGQGDLLAKAVALDNRAAPLTEQSKLLLKIEKYIVQKKYELDNAIDEYNSDCGSGKRLSPVDQEYCEKLGKTLSEPKAALDDDISRYNAEMAPLKVKVDALRSDVTDWSDEVKTWFDGVNALINSTKSALGQ